MVRQVHALDSLCADDADTRTVASHLRRPLVPKERQLAARWCVREERVDECAQLVVRHAIREADCKRVNIIDRRLQLRQRARLEQARVS
eukprot:6515463-Prymnesium_polylepis.1